MNTLGEKSLDVLRIAQITHETHGYDAAPKREVLFKAACRRWSTNAVLRKFDDLARKGYIECDFTPRTGWLTDKGRRALEESS